MPTKEEALKQIGDDFVALIKNQAEQIGEGLVDDLDSVSEYAAQRAEHLSTVVGEPGFDQALIAERDSIAIRIAIRAVDSADDFDNRLLAVVRGGLSIAANALRVIV